MSLFISIIGALTAIIVSITSAILSNRNSIKLQTRKVKEDHYIRYIEALHNLSSNNTDVELESQYAFRRDKIFLIASEEVINKILKYEQGIKDKDVSKHDEYLTEVYKAIRKDLNLKNKKIPTLGLMGVHGYRINHQSK